jgi:hypothetical protein
MPGQRHRGANAGEGVQLPVTSSNSEQVVYFARRMSDGMIKVGTSRNVLSRMAWLAEEVGPVELLAVERGAFRDEREWHDQFRTWRFRDASGHLSEWFVPAASVLDAIGRLEPWAGRRVFGEPDHVREDLPF